MSSSKQVIVSSSDPDIKYNGTWTFESSEDLGDIHWTGTPSSGFTYKFVGTSVSVAGLLNITDLTNFTPLLASFAVDDDEFVTRIAWNTTKIAQVLWFESDPLSSGQHQLSVNVESSSNINPFIFFALYYVPSEAPAATVTLTSLVAAPTAAATHLPDTDTVAGNVSKSNAPLGAIIGGVVGGCIFVALVSLGLWYYFANRKTQRAYFSKLTNADEWLDEDDKSNAKYPPPPVPYDVQSSRSSSLYDPPPPSQIPLEPVGESRDGSGATGSVLSSGSRRTTGTLSVANPTDESPMPVVPRSKAEEAGLLPQTAEATYHHDSGIRFGSAGEPSGSGVVPLTDIPPSYSAA